MSKTKKNLMLEKWCIEIVNTNIYLAQSHLLMVCDLSLELIGCNNCLSCCHLLNN